MAKRQLVSILPGCGKHAPIMAMAEMVRMRKSDIQFPENDGIFLVDLETGDAKLIVSIADVKDRFRKFLPRARNILTTPFLAATEAKFFGWHVHRPQRNTTAFTVNVDGSNLQACFPPGWGGSHFDWLNGDELMITSEYEAKQYSHVLFTVRQKKITNGSGRGLLDYDGHGTFSPDGKWMVTDTYPHGNAFREQKIYLMDMKTQAVLPIGNSRTRRIYGTVALRYPLPMESER